MAINDIVVVGAGPSGLAAAHEAVGYGASVSVLERLDRVGGLARTIEYGGNRFDIGPHRFFTRNEGVAALYLKVLGNDVVRVPRLTRIVYGGKYFNYPLTPLNALSGVGVAASAGILGSYTAARARRWTRPQQVDTFEDWVVDKFGRRLFEMFFKTYTEKVWGIPCTQIGADWADQRIKGLSLGTAITHAIFKSKSRVVKTLVDEFSYPRLGAGQAYEKMSAQVSSRHSSTVLLGTTAKYIRREGALVRAVGFVDADGKIGEAEGRQFLVSAPLTDLIDMITPPVPAQVADACRALRYRNHVGVNLVVEGNPFPDNWIYVHAKEVAMARIANYRNFSPQMSSNPAVSPLTVEYFAFENSSLWNADDESLVQRAIAELSQMKILDRDRVTDGFVVRNAKAYPVIEIGYAAHIEIIRAYLNQFQNLLPIGRSGMFKYNNQDHAMATGLLAARTMLGVGRFDPWLVNIDAEYHEGGQSQWDAPKATREPTALVRHGRADLGASATANAQTPSA